MATIRKSKKHSSKNKKTHKRNNKSNSRSRKSLSNVKKMMGGTRQIIGYYFREYLNKTILDRIRELDTTYSKEITTLCSNEFSDDDYINADLLLKNGFTDANVIYESVTQQTYNENFISNAISLKKIGFRNENNIFEICKLNKSDLAIKLKNIERYTDEYIIEMICKLPDEETIRNAIKLKQNGFREAETHSFALQMTNEKINLAIKLKNKYKHENNTIDYNALYTKVMYY